MENIFIEPKSYLPLVDFKMDGNLKLEGRSIPEDASKFYNLLIDFVDDLKVVNVTLDINLEYFNTASSKKLLDLLKHLDSNSKVDMVSVNWYFEEDDEDSVETAEIYEELLQRIDFRYLKIAEAA
jgi:hypothetical protein